LEYEIKNKNIGPHQPMMLLKQARILNFAMMSSNNKLKQLSFELYVSKI